MTQPTEASHPNGDFGFGGRARQTVKIRRLFADSRPPPLKAFSADLQQSKKQGKKWRLKGGGRA